MVETSPNQRTVTVKMKRIELINLHMLLGAFIHDNKNDEQSMKKWKTLYENLGKQREDFDRKNGWIKGVE